jgi:hypothetical protein
VKLYVNAVDPYAIELTVTVDDGPSLIGSTAAAIHMMRPDGTTATWSATLGAVTATSATVSRKFAVGDLVSPGEHRFYVVITTPSGNIRSDVGTQNVLDEFQTI